MSQQSGENDWKPQPDVPVERFKWGWNGETERASVWPVGPAEILDWFRTRYPDAEIRS